MKQKTRYKIVKMMIGAEYEILPDYIESLGAYRTLPITFDNRQIAENWLKVISKN